MENGTTSLRGNVDKSIYIYIYTYSLHSAHLVMAMFPGDSFGYSRKGGSGDPSLECSVGTGCTKKVIFNLVALIPKQMPSKKRMPISFMILL